MATAARDERTIQKRHQGLLALRWLLLGLAFLFYALHFVHLKADFPNDSPWNDWSKYTDEGWYGDAAVRHFLYGHWYLQGDFNPAVALPVLPLLEAVVFRFTGVSLAAARAVSVGCLGVMLGAIYLLMRRFPQGGNSRGRVSLAAPLCVLLICINPFFFAFSRLALLEVPLAMFAALALLVASYLQPWPDGQAWRREWLCSLGAQILLALLLLAMVLTKTTAVSLFPAVTYMIWHRAGYRLRLAWRVAALPFGLAGCLWGLYVYGLVRPRFWEDYQYLFSANAYTGFQLQPLATVLSNTFGDGLWMGGVLYPAFFVAIVLALFARPAFFRNPLVPALLLWASGYFVFLAYHNNLQPRYYLVPAVPVTMVVALALDEFRYTALPRISRFQAVLRVAVPAAVLLAIAVPDALLQLSFVLHPEFTYQHAAEAIAGLIRSDPRRSPLLLSVSGSDITLMTGLPSIDDDFGTLDLDERVRQYRPGWYAAWNQIDDDKMDALTPLYQPVRVAAFPALDDPDRDQLILYRLDPAEAPGRTRHRRARPPRPLRTRIGQQPTTTQLQH